MVILSKKVDQCPLTVESFTIELVSKASAQNFPDDTLSSFTNFLPEQLNMYGQWEVGISEVYYPSRYQIITEGKLMFFDKTLSKSAKFHILEPGLYPSIMHFVETMDSFLQERHNQRENCITIKLSQRTHEVKMSLANEESGRALFSSDLGQCLVSNVGNEFGVTMRGKGPHKPEIA